MLLLYLYFFIAIAVSPTQAQQCSQGFDLVTKNSTYTFCRVLGCRIPYENRPCQDTCIEGFEKTDGGLCYVQKCASKQTICQKCELGFQLKKIPDSSVNFYKCTPMNCKLYHPATMSCIKCEDGYEADNRGRCRPSKCVSISDRQNVCEVCQEGFSRTNQTRLVPSADGSSRLEEQAIIRCTPDNCREYSRQKLSCLVCEGGFNLEESTGRCIGQAGSTKATVINRNQNIPLITDPSKTPFVNNNTQGNTNIFKFEEKLSESTSETTNIINISNNQNSGVSSSTTQGATTRQTQTISQPTPPITTTNNNRANTASQLNQIPNCSRFNEFGSLCLQCQPGYLLIGSTTCVKEVDGCSNYNLEGCLRCNNAYERVQNNQGYSIGNRYRCRALNCLEYEQKNGVYCQKCDKNYQQFNVSPSSAQVQNVCRPLSCQSFNVTSWQCMACFPRFQIQYFAGQNSGFVSKCITKNCMIFEDNLLKCKQCQPEYELIDGNCLHRNCKRTAKAISSERCPECRDGWLLNANGNCLKKDCLEYDSQQSCTKCKQGRKLVNYMHTQGALCIKDSCLLRNFQDGICYQCEHDYFRPPGNPAICVPNFCQDYDNSTGQCFMCIPSFDLLFEHPEITQSKSPSSPSSSISGLYESEFLYEEDLVFDEGQCISTLCQEYQNKPPYIEPQCTKCPINYIPENNYCILSPSVCSKYDLPTGKCMECPSGYSFRLTKILKSEGNFEQEQVCVLDNCLRYVVINETQQDENSKTSSVKFLQTKCQVCEAGYELKTKQGSGPSSVEYVCQLMNCTEYQNIKEESSQLGSKKCTACQENFSLFINICIADNCLEFNQIGLCMSCRQGFFLNQQTKACQRMHCLNDSLFECLKCEEGYQKPDSMASSSLIGLCLPINCADPSFGFGSKVSQIVCQSCQAGYKKIKFYGEKTERCRATNCLKLDQKTGKCLNNQCRTGFKFNSTIQGCVADQYSGVCPPGRYYTYSTLTYSFGCSDPKAVNCFLANPSDTSQCYECNQDSVLDSAKFVCIPQQFSCQIFDTYYKGCQKCASGYTLKEVNGVGQCQNTQSSSGSIQAETKMTISAQNSSNNNQTTQVTTKQISSQITSISAPTPAPAAPTTSALTTSAPTTSAASPTITKQSQRTQNIQTTSTPEPSNSGQTQIQVKAPVPKCQQGFQLVKDICVQLPAFCAKLDKEGKCAECLLSNRQIQPDGSCLVVTANCQQYDPIQGTCTYCKSGYQLSYRIGSSLPFCLENPTSEGKITPTLSSSSGTNLNQIFNFNTQTVSGTSASRIPNCLKDKKITDSNGEAKYICDSCQQKYILNPALTSNTKSEYQCIIKIPNCKTHMPTLSSASTLCQICEKLYYLTTSRTCQPYPPNCISVVDGTNGKCHTCQTGMELSQEGRCIRKVQNCSKYSNLGLCIECRGGYSLKTSSEREICEGNKNIRT